ncbi:hypothetical protein Pla86_28880 [Planctomycetes bacterium Pla86]|uniref:N-acetyltransferase domain-containing protein n=1 Tax=Engelhardtia mirabilis TaxID=2528011 RepID=A0A518BLF0_9BACT|nr:hypothetical protein Pla133_28890 [Planctomycetes bacterium Pla133]QDV02126.1 hypothetical protein Pla86_28880 [Planctomycetes bacterium Pla86]
MGDVPEGGDTRRGPLHALRGVAGAIRWSFVFDRFDVFVKPVEAEHVDFTPPPGYSLRFGSPEDLAACTQRDTELSPRDREVGARRLEVGHRLVVAIPDGDDPASTGPVFTMWVNPRNLNVPGSLKRALGPDQVFIYKAYTSPEHRGRKLYQAGMRFVLADLASRGAKELVGYAHVAKGVSRRGLDAVGFGSVGGFLTLGFKRWQWTLADAKLRRRFPRAVPRSGSELDR